MPAPALCLLALGATPVTTSTAPLTVAIAPQPPVAMKDGDGWDGIGVHLWRVIADRHDLTFRWTDSDDPVGAVADGQADLAVVATPTLDRLDEVDFSHPYLASRLATAEPRRDGLWAVVMTVVSARFLWICVSLSILLLVVGLLVWLVERRANEDHFATGARGVWDGFWWAGVTMSTIGYGDRVPKSTPGRILALVWMLLAMVVTASLTASLVSAAQRAGLGPVSVPDGLRDLRVTCVEGSLAARYLEQERVRCTSKPTLEAAVRAVTNGQADVAVDDALALRHANRTHASGRLRVRETRHMPQPHTFAVRAGSPLAPLLDRALLERTQDAGWAAVLERYAPTRGER